MAEWIRDLAKFDKSIFTNYISGGKVMIQQEKELSPRERTDLAVEIIELIKHKGGEVLDILEIVGKLAFPHDHVRIIIE